MHVRRSGEKNLSSFGMMMGAHEGCVYRGDCFIPFSLQQSTDLFVFTMDFTYTYACINYDQSTNIIYGYLLNPTHAGNRRV